MTKTEAIIEAILFAAGRPVEKKELVTALELSTEEIELEIQNMQEKYIEENRGIEIIKVENAYQLCTKQEFHEYIYPILDNRVKPSISNAAMETLAIIAYNPKITTKDFLRLFGMASLDELPDLPRYKLDENEQIVIDEIIEQKEEAPCPEREILKDNQEKNYGEGNENYE